MVRKARVKVIRLPNQKTVYKFASKLSIGKLLITSMFSASNKKTLHPKGRAFLTSFLTTNTLIQILGYYVLLVFISALIFGGVENLSLIHI